MSLTEVEAWTTMNLVTEPTLKSLTNDSQARLLSDGCQENCISDTGS